METFYLWEWYKEIFTPPNRVTFQDIHCWCLLTGHELMECEVKAIRMIDAIRTKVMSEPQ